MFLWLLHISLINTFFTDKNVVHLFRSSYIIKHVTLYTWFQRICIHNVKWWSTNDIYICASYYIKIYKSTKMYDRKTMLQKFNIARSLQQDLTLLVLCNKIYVSFSSGKLQHHHTSKYMYVCSAKWCMKLYM